MRAEHDWLGIGLRSGPTGENVPARINANILKTKPVHFLHNPGACVFVRLRISDTINAAIFIGPKNRKRFNACCDTVHIGPRQNVISDRGSRSEYCNDENNNYTDHDLSPR